MFRWLREIAPALCIAAIIIAASSRSSVGQLAPIDVSTPFGLLISQPRPLLLRVTVNGVELAEAQPFVLTPPNRLAAQRHILQEIGIAVAGDAAPTSLIDLDTLPTDVVHRFDEAAQCVAFTVPNSRRHRRTYDVRPPTQSAASPVPDWGGFLNYSLFAAEQTASRDWFRFSGANASLDAHVFGPAGSFSQSVIVGNTLGSRQDALRLETTYSIHDQDRMLSGQIGDVVSGGVAWSRPIRLGGFQIQRDFALQPGLVRQPLPSFSGSAAVPSTVDVFVGSTKLLSQKVDPGPYQLLNIPSVTNGTGSVVMTDATGRQTQANLPLYGVASLLRPSLTDFSVEAGFARRRFGLSSDSYDDHPVASGTFRQGVTPTLTVDGHAEAGAGVVNGGAGAIAGTPWGTLEGALSLSQDRGFGTQLYASYDVQLWAGVLIHASVQARTSAFDDLAGATSRLTGSGSYLGSVSALDPGDALITASRAAFQPPKSLAQLSAFVPLPFVSGTASASLIDQVDATDARNRILSLSLNHPLPFQASAFITAFLTIGGHGSSGVLAGVSMPLGSDTTISVGGGAGSGSTGTVVAQRALGQEAGSVGWELANAGTTNSERIANASYRSGLATVSAGVTQDRGGVGGTAAIEGSVGVMGEAVAFGNHIQDSFAIVDAGLPDVAVLQDNRPVGTTDRWGHFLVSDLNTYQTNHITIDPLTMPIHADTRSNQATVVPTRASGVRVDFGGESNERTKTIVIVDAAGRPLPPGSRGRLDEADNGFVVGYGGQAYVRHLKATNTATIETGAGECHISFPFDAPSQAETTRQVVQCS